MTTEKPQEPPHQLKMAFEIQRLKQDYESRQTQKRPLSHCVAVAYRQVIAACERKEREQGH